MVFFFYFKKKGLPASLIAVLIFPVATCCFLEKKGGFPWTQGGYPLLSPWNYIACLVCIKTAPPFAWENICVVLCHPPKKEIGKKALKAYVSSRLSCPFSASCTNSCHVFVWPEGGACSKSISLEKRNIDKKDTFFLIAGVLEKGEYVLKVANEYCSIIHPKKFKIPCYEHSPFQFIEGEKQALLKTLNVANQRFHLFLCAEAFCSSLFDFLFLPPSTASIIICNETLLPPVVRSIMIATASFRSLVSCRPIIFAGHVNSLCIYPFFGIISYYHKTHCFQKGYFHACLCLS